MTTKRLAILLAVLLTGLGSVAFIPKKVQEQPVGVYLELPGYLHEWWGSPGKITERERITLGPETEFARKTYTDRHGNSLEVTVVLAGHDMNTSIHRPERCLPAQGWTILESAKVPISIADRGTLETTRLHSTQMYHPGDGRADLPIYNLSYYWFVGATDQTGSHFRRSWIDMRDRVLLGDNQRWAYFTVATLVTKGLRPEGRDEKQSDEMIQAFIEKLAPRVLRDSVRLH